MRSLPLGLVIASLLSAVFCVALNNTTTAILKITNAFYTIDDLLYAKLYTMISVKTLFLVALFLFELGSLICGVSPSSTALVVGRAIARLGAAGIFTGASTAIA
ncbi:hypothetical protein D6D24_10756 [Aureobasidium pullulans]|uniref:Major facilitator superfamily (MFS) profile domain-containing protein n=1 Tax=Aureobasidium pullulans TaxID=5580 RepID=A0A4S8UWB1_AURPU|nr:hypothetical protein D6D24_10756 [Aureobasidium pullulans]